MPPTTLCSTSETFIEQLAASSSREYLSKKAISPSESPEDAARVADGLITVDDREKHADSRSLLSDKSSLPDCTSIAYRADGTVFGNQRRGPSKLRGLLQRSVHLHSCGLYKEAVDVAREALKIECSKDEIRAECETQLASGLAALGSLEESRSALERALAFVPNYVPALMGLSLVFQEMGPHCVSDAIRVLRKAIECDAGNQILKEKLAELLTNVGARLKHAAFPAEAVTYFENAIAIAPSHAHAYYNLGVAHADMGKIHTAQRHYEKCISINPMHTEALANLGALHKSHFNNNEVAISYYERALSTNPNHESTREKLAVAITDLANCQVKSDSKRARKLYKKALALDPLYASGHYNLGLSYHIDGKLTRALSCYRLATHLDPNYAAAWNNLGVVYKALSNNSASINCYKRAIEVEPKNHRTHNNLAVMYTLAGDYDAALSHIHTSLSLDPHDIETHNNYGVLLRDSGDIDGAILAYEKAIELDPTSNMPFQNRLHALHYSDHWTVNQVFSEHKAWGEMITSRKIQGLRAEVENIEASNLLDGGTDSSPNEESRKRKLDDIPKYNLQPTATHNSLSIKGIRVPVDQTARGREHKLKVGLFGGDWFTHAVSYFSEGLLKYHDPEFITLFVYSSTANPDATTKRMQQYPAVTSTWRELPMDCSDSHVHSLVRRDSIDIAVDLSGHTASNLLSAFVDMPVPITATWIGYPNTSGLKLTYRISDPIADPVSLEPERFHTEESLWRLPRFFLGYCPLPSAPPIPPPTPFLQKLERHNVENLSGSGNSLEELAADTTITFGSFNVFAKMQNRCLGLWARLLLRVPGSRLLLKSRAGNSLTVRQRIWGIMQKHGISPERVEIRGMTPSVFDHLLTYGNVDIALDTFPYTGTTTTFEAMYMGVPVVTLALRDKDGDFGHVRNVGAAIMEWGGWADKLVADDEDIWIEKVTSLLADRKWRMEFRRDVRKQLINRMGAGDVFGRTVREMWLGMWKEQGGTLEDGVPYGQNSVKSTTSGTSVQNKK